MPPIHSDGYARTLAAIQASLTTTELEAARATGRTHPLAETIARAAGGCHTAEATP
jgi:hypothetical protein